MRAFATALQPDTRAGLHRALLKLNAIIPPGFESPLLVSSCDHPPVNITPFLRRDGWQEIPGPPQHLDVRVPPVPRRRDNEIHLEVLFARDPLALNRRDGECQPVPAVSRGGYRVAAADSVGPAGLIRTQVPALVVHTLVDGLDKLEADNTVVCGFGVGEEAAAAGQGLGVDLVDEGGVEDGIDAWGLLV